LDIAIPQLLPLETEKVLFSFGAIYERQALFYPDMPERKYSRFCLTDRRQDRSSTSLSFFNTEGRLLITPDVLQMDLRQLALFGIGSDVTEWYLGLKR
jgi:hypothetical protein